MRRYPSLIATNRERDAETRSGCPWDAPISTTRFSRSLVLPQRSHRRCIVLRPNHLRGTELPAIGTLDLIEVELRSVFSRLRDDEIDRWVGQCAVRNDEADSQGTKQQRPKAIEQERVRQWKIPAEPANPD